MMKDAKNPTSIGEKPTPLFADPCMSSDHAISLYLIIFPMIISPPPLSRRRVKAVLSGVEPLPLVLLRLSYQGCHPLNALQGCRCGVRSIWRFIY